MSATIAFFMINFNFKGKTQLRSLRIGAELSKFVVNAVL